MSYLASSRCRLFYEDSAEREPGLLGKPAVLFVNGWAISSRYWKPLVDLLTPDFRCITYDQSGTGKTEIRGYNPSFTIDGFATEAGELIERLGLQQTRNLHIVGHSMGGMVATELCMRYPEALLSATITACGIFEETIYTSLGLLFLGGLIDTAMQIRSVFQMEPLRTLFIKRAATKAIGRQYSDIIVEDFIRSDREATNAVGKFSIDPEALRTYRRNVIEISSPVLCCVGMADNTIPPEGTLTLYEKRKELSPATTSLARFMSHGHLPMLEDTPEYAAVLKKHFEFAGQFYKKTPGKTLSCGLYTIP